MSKLLKRTESTTKEKLRVESSTWSWEVSVTHSSSHNCMRWSTANKNLLTNSVSLDSLALKICLCLSMMLRRALMLVVAMLNSPKNIPHAPA